MSRNKDYQRLLNSRRWKELRVWKLQRNPLCEICKAEGYVRAAVDVHHIRPVESAHSLQEMEQLAFETANLMALCIPCHQRIHRELRSHSKEAHKQRQSESMARWAARHGVKAEEAGGDLTPRAPIF